MTKQLADRHTEDIDIELWLVENDKLLIQVYSDDISFMLEPKDGKEAMEMFNHPFAYRKVA